MQKLRRRQETLLAEAQDNATASAAASSLLRESAHLMTGVLDAVTEQSIIATDRSGRIDVFNVGAQNMLGVAAHDVVGRANIMDFHLPEELAAHEGADASYDALLAPVLAGRRAGSGLDLPPRGRLDTAGAGRGDGPA